MNTKMCVLGIILKKLSTSYRPLFSLLSPSTWLLGNLYVILHLNWKLPQMEFTWLNNLSLTIVHLRKMTGSTMLQTQDYGEIRQVILWNQSSLSGAHQPFITADLAILPLPEIGPLVVKVGVSPMTCFSFTKWTDSVQGMSYVLPINWKYFLFCMYTFLK